MSFWNRSFKHCSYYVVSLDLELIYHLTFSTICSIPGRYDAFWKEFNYVKNLWKTRQDLKIENAGIAALFGLECYAWFCGGEIVGRGFTFTGYHV